MNIRAYLELSRLSNAPTCITNVLTGAAIGLAGTDEAISWTKAGGMSLAILCLYVGGMALNDLFDARIDAERRPGRPIPSGRVSPLGAALFGTVAIAAGAALATLVGPTSLVPISVLVAAILIYDLTHKQTASAVVLMGMCRGLVYVSAAAAIAVPIDWHIAAPLALALTAYTIAITIVARVEDGGRLGAWRWMVPFLPLVIAAPVVAIRPVTPEGRWVATAAGVAAIVWLIAAARDALASTPRVRNAVLKWLSGMCLIDALYLGLLDQPEAAIVAAVLFFVTVTGHRLILGT